MMMFCSFLNELIGPLYIWLSPVVAILIFILATILAIVCTFQNIRLKEPRIYFVIVAFSVLSGLYSVFNVYDYFYYQRYGLARSPINELFYSLFSSPRDLYKPYKIVALSATKSEYSLLFKHRYGGRQVVVLNLINNTPKEFEYGNPDKINLGFETTIKGIESNAPQKFSRNFTTYYLSPGTNQLVLCQYDINSKKALSTTYQASLQIDGCLDVFLKKYPDSFIAIRNGTCK